MKQNGILQTGAKNHGIMLDPRTKLFLLLTMSVFVLGGAGETTMPWLFPCLCVMPLLLLLSAKKIKTAIIYLVVYSVAYLAYFCFASTTTGIIHFLLLGTAGIVTRFLPSLMVGAYVVSTTTVSEFTAGMLRMHLSEKLIIPLSVMFRFFPTVADEFRAINSAMRMRGISLGGKHFSKMLEYRFIPLMTCSVQIGNELSAAALTRGLGENVRRTNVCDIGFRVQDYAVLALCAVPYVFLILGWIGVIR